MYGKRAKQNRNRRSRRRMRTYKRKPNSRTMYRIAKSAIKNTAEHKLIQTSVSGQTQIGPITPQFTLCNGIVQGTTQATRIGNRIQMVSLQCNIRAYNGVATFNTVAAMLLYDRDAAQAAPVIGDIYDTSVLRWYQGAPRNLDNRTRFQILKKWRFSLSSTDSDDKDTQRIIEYYKKISLPTVYDDTNGGTILDIRKGSLYFVWSSSGSVVTPEVGMDYQIRLRFIDV